jgi:hypothetical protein
MNKQKGQFLKSYEKEVDPNMKLSMKERMMMNPAALVP